MVGEAGTQDRTDDDWIVGSVHWCYPERRLNTFFAVSEILTDLVSHDFSDTLNIATETKAVFLYVYISKFCNKLV